MLRHHTRRSLLGGTCGAAVATLLAPLLSARPALAAGEGTSMTPLEALEALKEGNRAFVAGTLPEDPAIGVERRMEIAQEQTPFAVVVACSDSRVPPELLFGRGLGEVFTVRNAGNTVDTAALGSVEYAVLELGVPLVVVLGHERCGAVQAAVSVVTENASFPGAIGRMVEPILPAVLAARDNGGDLLEEAVRQNVLRVAERLRTVETTLAEPIAAGRLRVVGARYDLEDGHVEFFDEG